MFIVRLFERCGYDVGSRDKVLNPILNALDIVLVLSYMIFSYANLWPATPSVLLLLINAVTLSQFLVKNSIEQLKVYHSKDDKNKKSVSVVHIVKISIESVVMALSIYYFTWSVVTTNDLAIVKPMAGVVIFITLVENIWAIMERMYDAVPKPLSY